MENDEALLKVVAMLAAKGLTLKIVGGDAGLSAWFEDGFYKSDGMARLVVEDGRLFLRARYDERTEVVAVDVRHPCPQTLRLTLGTQAAADKANKLLALEPKVWRLEKRL